MTEPSGCFVLASAAIYALAPKSTGPALLLWAAKYTDGSPWARDALDTWGRLILFWLCVAMSRLLHAILP